MLRKMRWVSDHARAVNGRCIGAYWGIALTHSTEIYRTNPYLWKSSEGEKGEKEEFQNLELNQSSRDLSIAASALKNEKGGLARTADRVKKERMKGDIH